MAQFKYTSIHPCHLTLKLSDGSKEFSFFKDKVYDLPEDNSIVKRMVAQGLFVAVQANTQLGSSQIINTQLKNKKSNG
jgi:hypothetical protein